MKRKPGKRVVINGFFPDLPSAKAYASGAANGSSVRVAAARAFSEMLKHPYVRGRRVKSIKADIFIFDKLPEDLSGQKK